MAEAVKVIVRCRPLNSREKSLNCKVVIEMDSSIGQVALFKPDARDQPPKTFTFDGAFYIDSITENIYADIVYPLVEGVVEGYNGTVFAYGQTGCGKSFTMQGITDPPTQRGITPRAFEHIFESIQTEDNAKYLVHASYLEIYNEEIRDLMGKDHKQRLEVKEHPDKGVYVKDLTMSPCHSVADMDKVMDLGGKNRSVGATLMNADSSRSHSIFTIFVETCETGPDGQEHIRAGKLNLVDLAGSERQAKTGASGDRLKEATKINLSLSALGNVISALVDGKSKHIPYRDSKLTRLLQDSLGGNTKTLMVSCVSPADNNYDETLSTLRYANRAKNIKNKPKINEDPKDALLRQYQDEITILKQVLMGQVQLNPELLAKLGISGDVSGQIQTPASSNKSALPAPPEQETARVDHSAEIAAQTEQIRKEYEEKLANLQRMYEEEQTGKQKLQESLHTLQDEYNKKLEQVQQKYSADDEVSQSEEIVNKFQAQGDSHVTTDVNQNEIVPQEEVPQDGVKAFKSKSRHSPSIIQQLENGAQKIQTEATKGLNLIKNKVLSKSQQELAVSVSVKDGEVSDPNYHMPEEGQVTSGGKIGSVAHHLQEEAMKRLQSLQEQLVGGEKRNDQKLKEKRKARKNHALLKREKLIKAVENLEDDGIMVKVYDNLQDELKVKNKRIDKLENEVKTAESEIHDLQTEFERDREDYLETIRKLEQQLKLQQQLLDKIQPCIRRDCNYFNLDKVRRQSQWNEEDQKWSLPDLVIERTVLPTGVIPGTRGTLVAQRSPHTSRSPMREEINGEVPPNHFEQPNDDKFLRHLTNSSNEEFAASYFKPKRADKLLAGSSSVDQVQRRESQQYRFMNSSKNNHETPPPGMSNGIAKEALPRSLEPISRPTRLESLPPSAFQKRKKKKNYGWDT